MSTRWIIVGLLSLLTTVIHGIVFSTSAGDAVEPFALDLWVNVREHIATPEVPKEVVLIGMDEQSYSILDIPMTEIWPRDIHARLVDKLAKAGAKRVVFDILFLDRSPNPAADKQLAEALKKIDSVLGSEIYVRQESTLGGTFVLEEYQEPYDAFLSDSTAALVGLPAEQGRIRRFYTSRPRQFEHIPTLAEAAAGIEDRTDLNIELPSKRDFINYYGPPGRIATFYYSRVLEDEHPLPMEEIFKDKIVIVGLVLRTEIGPAQKDVFLSPFIGRRIYGSEVHATLTANLLQKDWIRRGSFFVELCVLSLYCFGIALLIFALRPHFGLLVLVGAQLLWSMASYLAFNSQLFFPGLGLSFIILPIAFFGSTLYYYFITRRSQIQIRNAFEHYVSPEMANQMAQNTKSLKLGGEKTWATVMFTDIAGFTEIAEGMQAEKVSAMLNDYFTEVMEVVFKNRGTLIKFIGDAVFVIWGAPIKIEEHADLAMKAAMEIRKVVHDFNAKERYPALHTRIGLNTGLMVVGNLGSTRRFDYTAIGDAVNLAARVEGINKYLGTEVLITEHVAKELSPIFELVPIGVVAVAGKKELVELHTVFPKPLDEPSAALLQGGIMLFKERKWDEAAQCFEKLVDHEYLKSLVSFYQQQVQYFRSESPPPDWKGSLNFSQK